MMDLLIIGAGGHGKVVADTAQAAGYEDIAFLDESYPTRPTNGRFPIIGKPAKHVGRPMFCAIGNNATRARFFEEYDLIGSPVLQSPHAIFAPSVECGAGTVAVAGAIANADARIGMGCILNTGCSIDHDCRIDHFVHISPGARLAGGVTVADRSWIGIGAVVREGISIGHDVMVAAGAVVVDDIPDGGRVAGVPATQI